jgi:hypothetical protein
MKKIITGAISIATAALLTVSSLAVSTGKNLGTVPGTSAAITLDGKKDAAYSSALKIPGSFAQDGKSTPAASADFYVLYTKDALWVYCEVVDSTLNTKAADPLKPDFKVDSIEIMIDPTNQGENTPDVTPYQARIDHNNQVSARLGQKGTSLFLRKSEGGTVDFFDAQAVKTDKGFNAEFKITLPELAKGKELGINFCYNDWDKDGGTRIILGTTVGVDSWSAAKYDFVTLGEIVAETKPSTKPEQSASTSDIGIITASIALAVSAGVIYKKRRV